MEFLDLSLSTSPTPQLQLVEAAQPPVRHEALHDHDHDQWTSKQQRNKDLRIKVLNALATINSINPPNFNGNKVALKLSRKSIEQIQNIFASSSDKRQEGNNNDMHDHVKNDQPLLPSTVAPPKSFVNHRKASDKEHKRSPLGINKYDRGMWKKQILDNYLKSKTATQKTERDSSCLHDHDDGKPKHAMENFSSRRSSKRPMVQLDHHDFDDDDHADDCVIMRDQSPAPELNIPPPPPRTRRDIPRTLNLFPEVPELASSSSQHDHQEEDALTLSLFPTYPMNTCI